MKYLISISSVFLFLLGCNSKSQDKILPNAARAVNQSGVSTAEMKLCKSTEQLEEIELTDSMTVYYDFANFMIFGFVSGKQDCALKTDIRKNGVADDWYSVALPNECISNGSLWELKSISRQDSNTSIILKEYNTNNTAEIVIAAGFSVKLKELSSNAGMHFLKCMPKEK